MAAGTASASALAASSGKPVEIIADRTDYSQTFAEPGGGFKSVESLVPVRVREPGGSWVPVNTTLSVRPGGRVAPAAIATGLSLSGGGSGPLYTLSQDGKSLSASWPYGPLPVPSLSGPTATYANVLPGVNLLVSATATGVSELVEVMSAAAATSPALARITFPVRGRGVSVSADRHGNLTAADPAGTPVFTAAAPQMWDSAGSQPPGGLAGSTAPVTATGKAPAPGAHIAALGVSAGPDSLSLTSSARVLAGASTVYPVFIDPSWNGTPAKGATWLDVWKNGSGQVGGTWEPTDSTLGGMKSGVYCSPDSNGNCIDPSPDSTWGVYRSYMNFPLPDGYAGSAPDFVEAQLQITEKWSWSCSPSTVELWRTNHADRGIDWNGRPQELTWQDSANVAHGWSSGSCPAREVDLNATSALSTAGTPGYGSNAVTLELRAFAGDESGWNVNSWKRFDANTIDLVLYWRHAPSKPTNPVTSGVFDAVTGQTISDCSTDPSNPDYVDTNAPVWTATIGDVDGTNGGNIDGEFGWENLTTGVTGPWPSDQGAGGEDPKTHGFPFTGQRSGTGGDAYEWWAFGKTLANVKTGIGNDTAPVLQGPTSSPPPCYFTIDTTAPSAAPLVTSDVYTSGGTSNPVVGTPGKFTFAPNGVSDVVGYFYGIDNSSPSVYVQAGSGGSATTTITPFTDAELDLYVQSVDRAGNRGPVSAPFRIDPSASPGHIAMLAWWKLNSVQTGPAGTTSPDAMGTAGASAADVTLLSAGASIDCPTPASPGPDGFNCSLLLDGSSGRAVTPRPVVAADGSFSASAWARPVLCATTCTVMSQAASAGSVFTLSYQPSGTAGQAKVTCPCWVFSMPAGDPPSTVFTAAARAPGAANNWTQLTGVFNASHGQLELFVNGGDGVTAGNGLPAATAAASPWSSVPTGLLRLGSDWTSASGPFDFWDGKISDACVLYGALGSTDVQALYAGGSGDGCAALHATYP